MTALNDDDLPRVRQAAILVGGLGSRLPRGDGKHTETYLAMWRPAVPGMVAARAHPVWL